MIPTPPRSVPCPDCAGKGYRYTRGAVLLDLAGEGPVRALRCGSCKGSGSLPVVPPKQPTLAELVARMRGEP